MEAARSGKHGGKKMMKRAVPIAILCVCLSGTLLWGEPKEDEAVLLISQSQFFKKTQPDGSKKTVPGPARLVIARPGKPKWSEEVLEDPESNVFHKAMIYTGDGQAILTIAGTKAALKLWKKKDGKWTATTLWSPSFGGTFDRLRDVEVGDVTGDGTSEIVLATHDQGVVGVVRNIDGKWVARELDRAPETFVHEVEIGDVDGDGRNEFFVTPSDRNRATFVSQPGKIVMYRWKGGEFERSVVEGFDATHAKEILLADVDNDGTDTLFAAVEAETKAEGGSTRVVKPVRIRMYTLKDGKWSGEDIAVLNDRQCRFLACGDVDRDGRKELVAAGMKSGLWLLRKSPGGKWTTSLIDSRSSGYEHATYLADLDGDGADEIYVASDDQGEISRYRWKDGAFEKSVLLAIPADIITWNVVAGRLPKNM